MRPPSLAATLPVLLAVAIALAPAVAAAADAAPATSEECKQQYKSCQADCNTKHANDAVKRAACLPVCSARYAACDAMATFEKAKPWLEDKAKKTQKYLEDLMKNPPAEKTPAPAPAPQKMPDTTKT